VRETHSRQRVDDVSDIELIDLPPDELIKRLQDGKCTSRPSQRAIDNLRKGNRPPCAELTMRRAAERWMIRCAIICAPAPSLGPAGQRTPVGFASARARWANVSSVPPGDWRRTSKRMVRVYVETPNQSRISQEQLDQVAKSLRLARNWVLARAPSGRFGGRDHIGLCPPP